MINTRITENYFLFVLALFLQVTLYAQEVRVIDNKGTKVTVTSNSVTTAATAPTDQVEGDVWFDTSTNISKIYDGASWIEIDADAVTTAATAPAIPVTGDIWFDTTANATKIYDGSAWVSFETVTSMTQDLVTGTITYTNEGGGTPQTANVVGAETDNDLTIGANGGAFYKSPVRAFGKIASNGAIVKATPGITINKLPGNGRYRVNLPPGTVSDLNYIIQLAQPGRGGSGNDDPGISYSNQNTSSFEVIVGDNDNGGTDRTRYNSEFMFTVLDL